MPAKSMSDEFTEAVLHQVRDEIVMHQYACSDALNMSVEDLAVHYKELSLNVSEMPRLSQNAEVAKTFGIHRVMVERLVKRLPVTERAYRVNVIYKQLLRDYWADENNVKAQQERTRELSKERWQDPNFRRKVCDILRNPENSEKRSITANRVNQERWADPANHEKASQMMRIAKGGLTDEEKHEVHDFFVEDIKQHQIAMTKLLGINLEALMANYQNCDIAFEKMPKITSCETVAKTYDVSYPSIVKELKKLPGELIAYRDRMIIVYHAKKLWNDGIFDSRPQQASKLEMILADALAAEGLYAKRAKSAKYGQIYNTGFVGNVCCIKLSDGRLKRPDFKASGQKKVIEVNGTFWHSQTFCERVGLPDYIWNEERLIEEYAKVGYNCLVFWEPEVRSKEQRKKIVSEIKSWLKPIETDIYLAPDSVGVLS